MNYIGSKYSLLDFLTNTISSVIKYENNSQLVFADLFAGTGGIGLEFISRGAREVTAVELAHTQQNFIIQTCRQLGIHNLTVVRSDVFKYLNACHIQFDFIYADPPYALDELPTLPDLVLEKQILKPGGWFVLEHGKDNDFSLHPRHVETRKYGSVHFSFFQ